MQAHGPKFTVKNYEDYIEGDIYIKGEKAEKANADWTHFEMVLAIPTTTKTISFGFNMKGIGQMWIDDIKLEVTSQDTPEKFDHFLTRLCSL